MIIDMVNKLVKETMEGEEDMGRKSRDRLAQTNTNVVNQVKEEAINTMTQEFSKTMSETSAGFESLDEIIDEDEKWEEDRSDKIIEVDKIIESDEELKKKMRERNMENANIPVFGSLSNKVKTGKESNNKEDGYFWSIPNCQPVYRNGSIYKWITTLNCYQLNEMYSGKTPSVIYDPSVQRGSRTTAKGEEKPLIYTANVKTILSKMLDGSMDAGQVLLNYAKEYPEALHFNEDDNTLSGQHALTICDAAHRLESMKIWVKRFKKDALSIKDPREFYIPVVIFNLSHSESENLFVEANSKGKAVSRTRLAFHDVFNENRKIVDIIANQSLLKGKIELVSGTISKSSNKIITYKTLLDNVAQFKALNPKEAEEIGLYLVKFWDELISNIFPEAMGNIDIEAKSEQRKQNFILENMFISGFFALANRLRKENDWENRLTKLSDKKFLSRSNPIWNFCLREGSKLVNSSKVQKDIATLIINHVMEN